MSTATPSGDDGLSVPSTLATDGVRAALAATGAHALTAAAETAAFWTAIALPFAYVPILWGVGLGSADAGLALLALLALNVVALVVGHDHKRS